MFIDDFVSVACVCRLAFCVCRLTLYAYCYTLYFSFYLLCVFSDDFLMCTGKHYVWELLCVGGLTFARNDMSLVNGVQQGDICLGRTIAETSCFTFLVFPPLR